jgi:hypothetical protein
MAFLGGVMAVAAPDRTASAQRRALRYLDRVSLTVRTISTVDGHLIYNYRFGNAATSRASVASLALDLSAPLGTGHEWLPEAGPARHRLPGRQTATPLDHVPAGPISPERWTAVIDIDGQLRWWGIEGAPPMDTDTIAPGRSLDGFGVRSTYLPGIRDFFAKPSWQSCCAKPIPGSVDGEHPDPDEFLAVGRTVAPTRAPSELADPVRAIALIRRDVAAGYGLGWIPGGLRVVFGVHLDAAGAAAVSRDNTAVGRQLDALLKELETYRGRLNDNAYWLLRINAQYVRDQMR